MKTDVILLCAGSGQRMGAGMNKIFLSLTEDKLVLDFSLQPFAKHQGIRYIQPVISASNQEEWNHWQRHLCAEDKAKLLPAAIGGDSRQASVFAGLRACKKHCVQNLPDSILIHDAARCLLPTEIIDACLLSLAKNKACIPVLPVQDTLRMKAPGDENKTIGQVLDRSQCQLAQTPQAFPFNTIYAAYQAAHEKRLQATDDAELYQKFGEKVFTVPGNPVNFKLTTPSDLKLAQALLTLKNEDTF